MRIFPFENIRPKIERIATLCDLGRPSATASFWRFLPYLGHQLMFRVMLTVRAYFQNAVAGVSDPSDVATALCRRARAVELRAPRHSEAATGVTVTKKMISEQASAEYLSPM